jgi:nucleoside-diphosphate-sugar epimerase
MKISVTGSKGFIGTRLVELLQEKGHDVVEWDKVMGEEYDIAEWRPEECEAVVHLAGLANVRNSIKDPEPYWYTNVELSKRLFYLALQQNMRVIYASSSCAKKWWLSPYGTSKKAMENVAPPRSLGMRFTTVYGPGSRKDMLIGRIRDNNLLYVTDHTRDFIHVDDVCSAIIKNIDNYMLSGTIDVGTGVATSVQELAQLGGQDVPLREGEPCEAKENIADIKPLEMTGWKPKYNVKDYINMDMF